MRAVLGQQVSTAAARTHAGRLVAAHGEPVDDPAGGLTHLFPDMAALAALDPEHARASRGRAAGRSAPWRPRWPAARSTSAPAATGTQARARLGALPGLGPWSVETIAMRGLGDPDAFIPGDLGVRAAAARSSACRPRPPR